MSLSVGETGDRQGSRRAHAHRASGRAGSFVAVNCGALPDELFESELFRHVGGAFTGARREGSPGLIARADGGTLLLDEVTELPLPLRAAPLRFLDDGLVRPVRGAVSRKVDVQLLAATNASALQQGASDTIRREFERTGRSVSRTSRDLGISRTAVYRHLTTEKA